MRRERLIAHALALLFVIPAIPGAVGCAPSTKGAPKAPTEQAPGSLAMKDLLAQMVRDSNAYYVPEGLPGREALLKKLKGAQAPWQGLEPLHAFFVFETAPELLKQAPQKVAQAAYCAAMEALPGDWWGTVGAAKSQTSGRLLSIPGIDACLRRQLDNDRRVEFGDSESATVAKLGKYQVADLAALLLGREHNVPYRIHDKPEDRKANREALKGRLPR